MPQKNIKKTFLETKLLSFIFFLMFLINFLFKFNNKFYESNRDEFVQNEKILKFSRVCPKFFVAYRVGTIILLNLIKIN